MGQSTSTEEKMTGDYISEEFSLVKFSEDNKINFNYEFLIRKFSKLNFNVSIISIIGKSRTGKSALMNCIISRILGYDKVVFETSNIATQCTQGINACIIKSAKEDNGYLLLDCQGIEFEDSSMDDKLLLLPYLLSHKVIYNVEKKIDNASLKSLEPLLTFSNHIDPDLVS